MKRDTALIAILFIAIIFLGIVFALNSEVYKQIKTKENPRYIGIRYPEQNSITGKYRSGKYLDKEIWVSEAYHHSIAIYDADKDRLKDRIILGDPGDISFGRDKAYVVSKVQPYLYVIDIESREIEKKVPIEYPSTDVEVLKEKNKIYIANFLGHEVKILDLQTYETITEIYVGSGPREISITPDGEEAWVAIHNIDNVSIIDTDRDKVIKNLYLYDRIPGDMPLWIAFSKGKAYVALHQLPNLGVIDMETKEILGVVGTGGGSRAIGTSPDGEYVYDALLYQNQLVVINTSRGRYGEIIKRLPLGKTPMNLAVSPDNKVYVANTQSDSVSILTPTKEPDLAYKIRSALPTLPPLPWNVKMVKIQSTKDGFKPHIVKIKAGQTVKWVNEDDVNHDVAIAPSNDMWFQLDLPEGNKVRSPILEPGDSWSYTFKQEGEYKYWCKQDGHWESEKGTVLVIR